jgi:crossover junction endodeoxyribonuclease RusA
MDVLVVLPMPPKGLSPNDRVHWRTKAAATKKYREWAYLAGVNARNNVPGDYPWSVAEVQVTYYRRDRRGRMDGDNAGGRLKAAMDGLVDAGLLTDDRGLTHRPVRQEIDRKQPRVEVLLVRGNQ